MLIEINHLMGKYAVGCVTTSAGRLWAKGPTPGTIKPADGQVEVDVPIEEARIYLDRGMCKAVNVVEPEPEPETVRAEASVSRARPKLKDGDA